MASKRDEYVMSPELAMKREIACRQRLELLQLVGNSSESGKPPAPPKQALLSASTASRPPTEAGLNQSRNMRSKLGEQTTPIPWPTPKTIPSPRPKTMPSPRPNALPPRGPSSRPNALPPRGPNPRPNPFPPRGPSSLQRPSISSTQALAGLRTRPMIVGPRWPRPPVPHSPTDSFPRPKPSPIDLSTSPRPSLLPTPRMTQRLAPTPGLIHKRKEAPTQPLQNNDHDSKMRKLTCEACNVQCCSPSNLKMHIMGQKHQAQLKKGNEQVEDDSSLYCSLCEIWCINSFSLKQHLNGKNHIRKVQSAETEK